ncbi:hypothetical protein FJT64_010665 [Amphibalanus amphitrite]|uniref:HAT C-terminal dimerisation domain-containing protein n=1 Tax=Amphibalanus amphitrite TaxID=1232801 RepID=A0A6A4VDE7_AMPAM|nr:hypothetical protein FJT64_010665 [Amphibalanus amphitrite]
MKLKGLSDTRWNCRAASLRRLKDPAVLRSVLSVVEDVQEKTTDGVIRATALGLMKNLRDPKFIITLVALSPVMDLVDHVCNSLQSPQLDLLSAQELISSLAKELSHWQTTATWNKILEDAAELGSLIDVDINGSDESRHRARKIPARLKEFACDSLPPSEDASPRNTNTSDLGEGAEQPSEKTKQMRRVFCVADRLVAELERRFPPELGDFCILQRTHMFRDDADGRLERLAALYGLDLAELKSQWLLARNMIPVETDRDMQAAHALLPKEFVVLRWLYKVALTLPVTSAGVERKFSKMALLKSKLRTTMSQARLEHLMFSFSESDIASELNMEELVSKFARMGNRRMELL